MHRFVQGGVANGYAWRGHFSIPACVFACACEDRLGLLFSYVIKKLMDLP
jgi:hypothetical protein